MPSNRKRKRPTNDDRDVPNWPEKSLLVTIRAIIPTPNEIFFLPDFVKRYAPFLKLNRYKKKDLIPRIVISPLESIVSASHAKLPECREPLPGLIDDVIFSLVKRRDRLKRLGSKDGLNVLTQGYISQSIDEHREMKSSSQMRPGVICLNPNDKVSLCKSRVFQVLHEYVGDEILRMILLHTRLFLPLESSNLTPERNFILVSGPPLVSSQASRQQHQAVHSSAKRRKTNDSIIVRPSDRRIQPNATISRFSIFYSNAYIPKIGLSKTHPFNTTPRIANEKLLGLMTDLYNDKGAKRKNRWRRLRVFGPDICNQILEGHSKCDYPRLLKRYCPLPDVCNCNEVQFPDLVLSSTPSDNVVSFVISILKRVFPSTFWGSSENFSVFVESVRSFVNLRRQEKFANKDLMKGIRVTKISWLLGKRRQNSSLSKSNHETTTYLVLRVLRWVFQGFIIPLIRTNFHVTESEFTSKQLLYFRRPVWSIFRALSMKKLLQKQFLELSSSQSRRLISSQSMGFSQLRLLPKSTGVRPIAQLSRPPVFYIPSTSTDNDKEERPRKRARTDRLESYTSSMALHRRVRGMPSTNTVLGEAFDVLKYECSQRGKPFGAGLNGLEDFFPRYREYLLSLNRPRKALNLYFASVDIEKCFDNISQQYLFGLLKHMLSEDNYFIQQFNMFRVGNSSGMLEKITRKAVDPLHQDFQGVSDKFKGVVFDSRNCTLSSKTRVLKILEEHLQSHLVVANGRFGKRGLIQSLGIAQGSKLSSMLCNLYYGALETNLLQDFPDASSFLARLVDDFIFISTEKESNRHFLEKMYEGKAELGVRINRDKTIVSEPVDINLESEESFIHLDCTDELTRRYSNNHKLFPWCGMLFDTMTGEVMIDYSRFQGGKARGSLTVHGNGNEGVMLGVRMKGFVLPRCVPILYDSSINSFYTIVTNYHQMMLLGAVKTAEYLRSSRMSLASNSSFVLGLIDDLAVQASSYIKSNLRKLRLVDRSCRFVLDESMSYWLCWRAYHDTFSHLTDFQDFTKELLNRLSTKTAKRKPQRLEDTLADSFRQFGLSDMLDY